MTPKKLIIGFTFIALAMLSTAVAALAQADLRVNQWQGPSTALVRSPYQYSFRVRNYGNIIAQNTKVVITLPQTDTSPQKYIMGKITGLPTGCSVVAAARIECALGASNPGVNRIVSFTLEYPVTSKPLVMKAEATTTSYEVLTNNNSGQRTQTIGYPNLPLTDANVLVDNCTGRGLTSFFECELFPSSQQHFNMTLNQGGTITLPYGGAYMGSWDQPTAKQLHFSFTDGYQGVEFNGYASGSSCFEGIANFTPASSYLSPYKVCVQ